MATTDSQIDHIIKNKKDTLQTLKKICEVCSANLDCIQSIESIQQRVRPLVLDLLGADSFKADYLEIQRISTKVLEVFLRDDIDEPTCFWMLLLLFHAHQNIEHFFCCCCSLAISFRISKFLNSAAGWLQALKDETLRSMLLDRIFAENNFLTIDERSNNFTELPAISKLFSYECLHQKIANKNLLENEFSDCILTISVWIKKCPMVIFPESHELASAINKRKPDLDLLHSLFDCSILGNAPFVINLHAVLLKALSYYSKNCNKSTSLYLDIQRCLTLITEVKLDEGGSDSVILSHSHRLGQFLVVSLNANLIQATHVGVILQALQQRYTEGNGTFMRTVMNTFANVL
eukprot:m.117780 g.117780  ORF g.117780 m.117780 type:complete len:348 (-) comp14260_c0_seq1:786-1829(-)